MADAEELPIDDFFQEMEELLRGRFFYTVYTRQHNSHNRFFKRGNLKKCLIIGILITVLHELLVMTRVAEPGIIHELHAQPSWEEEPSKMNLETNYPMGSFEGQGIVYGELRPFDPAKERYTRPSSFKYANVVRTAQEQIEAQMAEESQDTGGVPKRMDISKMSVVQYIYRFMIRLCMVTGLVILVYFIVELISIAHDVIIRHIISVKKQRLIGGLIRFRRIV